MSDTINPFAVKSFGEVVEETHERGYEEGRRSLARQLLQTIGRELDADTATAASLTVERDGVRAKLRELSETLGCSDWPDDLHLVDVLDKYILPAVEDLLLQAKDDRVRMEGDL